MKPVAYYAAAEQTSPAFAYAFARGCNGKLMPSDFDLRTPEPICHGSVALFGSPAVWPVLRQAQADGRLWFYGDHGYFGRRKYYRITRNAYQHDGRGHATPGRFRLFKRQVQPWTTTGGHVLVCPNSQQYFALHGIDVSQWLADVIGTLRQHTDREIRVRWKTDMRSRPIDLDIAHAWATVVYSSVAALQTRLIAGVPIFTLAPFAASVRMGLSDLSTIERPIRPDGREPFLWALADHQWTMQEIFTGDAWRALEEQHEVDLAA